MWSGAVALVVGLFLLWDSTNYWTPMPPSHSSGFGQKEPKFSPFDRIFGFLYERTEPFRMRKRERIEKGRLRGLELEGTVWKVLEGRDYKWSEGSAMIRFQRDGTFILTTSNPWVEDHEISSFESFERTGHSTLTLKSPTDSSTYVIHAYVHLDSDEIVLKGGGQEIVIKQLRTP